MNFDYYYGLGYDVTQLDRYEFYRLEWNIEPPFSRLPSQ